MRKYSENGVFIQAAGNASVVCQALRATAKVVRIYALDFSQPVEVTVRAEDTRDSVLEHHSGVDQISGFESGVTFRKLPDPANVRERHLQGCGNDCLQLDADLPSLIRETHGQVTVKNFLMDLTDDHGP
jgi:hypothetical protein